jgi:hypothetical protein
MVSSTLLTNVAEASLRRNESDKRSDALVTRLSAQIKGYIRVVPFTQTVRMATDNSDGT